MHECAFKKYTLTLYNNYVPLILETFKKKIKSAYFIHLLGREKRKMSLASNQSHRAFVNREKFVMGKE
jgi:hypothetical protein